MVNIASRTCWLVKDTTELIFWKAIWGVKETVSNIYDKGVHLYLDRLESRIKRKAFKDAEKYTWENNI